MRNSSLVQCFIKKALYLIRSDVLAGKLILLPCG